jgi:translation initiation factor eIF-2B subunit alpha
MLRMPPGSAPGGAPRGAAQAACAAPPRAQVSVINPSRDYTPPAYIDLLVTDLGVLTPAAVSDEMIQLYV